MFSIAIRLNLSPVDRVMAIETVFLTIIGLRSSKVLTFPIAAYPVWFRCMLHDATVDILFGTACA